MNKLIELIFSENYQEAKKEIEKKLQEKVSVFMEEAKQYISVDILEQENLDESGNVVNLGRIQRIRKRVRRDSKGRIIVQTNTRRSALRGYTISGNSIRRISAYERMRRSQQLKRAWKTSRRAKLTRTLLKRKMSMRRRYSLGLR